jgi:hypothetical protein
VKVVMNLARDLPIAVPCRQLPVFAPGAEISHCALCRKDVHLLDPSRPNQLAALRHWRGALCVAYAVAVPALVHGQQGLVQDSEDASSRLEVVQVSGGGIGVRQLESLFAEFPDQIQDASASADTDPVELDQTGEQP